MHFLPYYRLLLIRDNISDLIPNPEFGMLDVMFQFATFLCSKLGQLLLEGVHFLDSAFYGQITDMDEAQNTHQQFVTSVWLCCCHGRIYLLIRKKKTHSNKSCNTK